MTTENKILLIIPFDGFYESFSDRHIFDEIENMFYIEDLCDCVPAPDEIYDHLEFRKIYLEYAKLYTEVFNKWFKEETSLDINFEFESLQSPKEYNYTTDRIFVEISEDDLQKLINFNRDDNFESFKKVLERDFTSCSGFASSYSNDPEDWFKKPINNWDHIEVTALLSAVMYIIDSEKPNPDYYYMMEGAQSNGAIAEIVWGAATKEIKDFADFQNESGVRQDFKTWLAEQPK